MLQAPCTTTFFAYLRCGEFTINNLKHDNILCFEDMVMDSEEKTFTLIQRRSKTDPFRNYMILRRSWYSRNVSSALFVDASGNPLLRHRFVSKLKLIPKYFGFADKKLQEHSFRIEAATSSVRWRTT